MVVYGVGRVLVGRAAMERSRKERAGELERPAVAKDPWLRYEERSGAAQLPVPHCPPSRVKTVCTHQGWIGAPLCRSSSLKHEAHPCTPTDRRPETPSLDPCTDRRYHACAPAKPSCPRGTRCARSHLCIIDSMLFTHPTGWACQDLSSVEAWLGMINNSYTLRLESISMSRSSSVGVDRWPERDPGKKRS